jgi:hypothetical protein
MIPPLIKDPPETSLPNPDQNRDWYGELWLQYPDGHALCPTNFSSFFIAKCRLLVILNRITFKFFKGEAKHAHPSSTTIVKFITELRKWYSSLPHSLGPTEVVFPSQLKLQYVQPDSESPYPPII